MSKHRLVTLLVILTLALSTFCNMADHSFPTASAFTFPKSSKIAMVPNSTYADPYPRSPYVGTGWPNGDSFTFNDVSVGSIENGNITDPIREGGYDTVVIMAMEFDFGAAWKDTDFSGRITDFVGRGGRLIIYVTYGSNVSAFANFIYPFTLSVLGGNDLGTWHGTLTNLINDSLSSTDPADVSFVNISAMAAQGIPGNFRLMTSYDSHWNIDLFGNDRSDNNGVAHAYAFYGNGLIIFDGRPFWSTGPLPSNDVGVGALEMLWWRDLSAQFLGSCANGFTIDPEYAFDLVNTTHTVTATVRNITNSDPIPGAQVNFSITAGPNKGLTGQGRTDASGQTAFSWSSSAIGTDTLSATVPNSNQVSPNMNITANETWVTHGPLSVSISPSNLTMDIGQSNLLTATPNGGSLYYALYQWYLCGSALSGQFFQTYIFAPKATGTYLITATVTDSSNSTSPQSGKAVVIVNDFPNVTISPIGPLKLKAGQNQIFTANVAGGSTPIHYQWYVDSAKAGTDNSTYVYVAGSNAANVSCQITDNASIPVKTLSNTVLINGPAPYPNTGAESSGQVGNSPFFVSFSEGSMQQNQDPTPTLADFPSLTPRLVLPPCAFGTQISLFLSSVGFIEIEMIMLLIVFTLVGVEIFRALKRKQLKKVRQYSEPETYI